MKLFSTFLLLTFLTTLSSATPLCKICSFWFSMPSKWDDLKGMLHDGCPNIFPAILVYPCQKIMENTDLTDSYPKMLPFMHELRDIGCAKFC